MKNAQCDTWFMEFFKRFLIKKSYMNIVGFVYETKLMYKVKVQIIWTITDFFGFYYVFI